MLGPRGGSRKSTVLGTSPWVSREMSKTAADMRSLLIGYSGVIVWWRRSRLCRDGVVTGVGISSPCRTLRPGLGAGASGSSISSIRVRFAPYLLTNEDGSSGFRSVQGYSEGICGPLEGISERSECARVSSRAIRWVV